MPKKGERKRPVKASAKPASKAKPRPGGKPGTTPVPRRPSQPIELPEGMWERIAQKAYEVWEKRGRQEGQALDDWLEAEAIVMEEIHEARE